jgi:hypothetical protein
MGATSCDTVDPPPENKPPVVYGLSDTTAAIGDSLVLLFSIVDPEGDGTSATLSFDLTRQDLAEGYWPRAGLFVKERIFWYTPRPRDGSFRIFGVVAHDFRGATTVKSFRVTILEPDTTNIGRYNYP